MLSSMVVIVSLNGLPYIASASPLPVCSAAHLRLTIEAEDVGMSHASATLAIRNVGYDCMLPSDLPLHFYDSGSKLLPVVARATASHKQVRVPGGHRVALNMRWVSSPVYTPAREVHVASIRMTIGSASLQVPLDITIFGTVSQRIVVSLTKPRPVEGMASDM